MTFFAPSTKFMHHRAPRVSARLGLLLMIIVVGRATAQQGADDDGTCPSDATPSDMLGPFYLAGSPSTTQIAPTDLLQDPTTRLSVSGRVLSLADEASDKNSSSTSSCTVGIPNVTVEVWYAGPPDSQGNYYRNDAFRGQMVTDECGRYSFVQVFPAQYPTRPILHDHFRLSAAGGTELLVTQMYFLSDNATATPSGLNVSSDGYVSYEGAYPFQAQTVQHSADGSRSVHFDLYLDNVQAGIVSEQSTSSSSSIANLCSASDNNLNTTSGQESNSSSDASSDSSSSSATSSSGGFGVQQGLAAVWTLAGIAVAFSTRSW